MAGPGGGAPRRSHTKSRKGCKTCKKRHIRCDENFPQCRNCTKHNCRCSYMDGPQPEGDAPKSPSTAADLQWTIEAEQDIDRWRATGELPWPEMQFRPRVPITDFSSTELRLLHHFASVSTQMQRHDTGKFTIWTYHVPAFVKIASSYDFVLHAVLALSASHLASVTECPMTLQIACHHRVTAVRGYQEAIGLCSRQNADAVLAASILLSFQATDWRTWKSLMMGMSSVIDAMRQWRSASHFPEYLEEGSTFCRLPASSPSADGQRTQEPSRRSQAALQRLCMSLQNVEAHAACREQETRGLQELMAFLRKLQTSLPVRSPAQQLEMLQPLRSSLLWLPVTLLEYGVRHAGELVVLAHVYAAAMVAERLFPDMGAACFGSMATGPIDEVTRTLNEMQATNIIDPAFPNPLALIEIPLEMMAMTRPTMGHARESDGLYSPIVIDHHHSAHAHSLARLTLETDGSDLSEQASARSVSYSSDGARSAASPMVNDFTSPHGLPHAPQAYYGSPLGAVEQYHAHGSMHPTTAHPHHPHHPHQPPHGSFPGMGWMGTPTSSVDVEADQRFKMAAMEFNHEELASPALWPVQ